MADKIKRLSPTMETIRELFGKCGNQCAFPGCKHEIIDAEGRLVAQICHIEAAETGGERFNPDQTNEQRRHVSNLMLMCGKHHTITNNVEKYPPSALQEMKKKHEQKYLDAVSKIWASIEDHTDSDTPTLATTFTKMFAQMECPPSEDERKRTIAGITALATKLQPVPVPCREMLCHSVRRASVPEYANAPTVIVTEIAQACNLRREDVWEAVRILIKHELVYLDDDYHGVYFLSHLDDDGEMDIWAELKSFSKRAGVELRDLLVDLRFNLLDE